MDKLLQNVTEPITIIHGNAPGADKIGENYAKQKGYSIKVFEANWKELGKKAGYVRNEAMAKIATHCVVFWDGKSKGSQHMIDLAKQYKLHLRIVRY